MTPATPPPSARLVRAADAERAELERHRARLLAAREDLHAELARIEAGLADVDDRRRLLDRLAPNNAPAAASDDRLRQVDADEGDAVPPRPEAVPDDARVLRGPAIRETAVRLLLERPDGVDALHYRDWFEFVTAKGYAIGGKDPLAVFLTQISRSPVVSRSTQAGVYAIDRQVSSRLHRQLGELHDQLRSLSASPAATADLAEIRRRRQELMTEIGHVEKALEEASRLLVEGSASELAAAV